MPTNEHDEILLTCARASDERLIEIFGIVLQMMIARDFPPEEIRMMINGHLQAPRGR